MLGHLCLLYHLSQTVHITTYTNSNGHKSSKKSKMCSATVEVSGQGLQLQTYIYTTTLNNITTSAGYSPCWSAEQVCACSLQWWLFSDLSQDHLETLVPASLLGWKVCSPTILLPLPHPTPEGDHRVIRKWVGTYPLYTHELSAW